jgi:2-enoate reductase
MKFKKLFEPIQIGKVFLKNRIAMAPVNLFPPSSLCTEEGEITERTVDFYTERAKGGVGMIITSVFKVEREIDKCSKYGVMTWPLFTMKNCSQWAEFVDNLHAYETKLFIQLSAGPGRNVGGDVLASGVVPVSASENIAYFDPKIITKPLTKDEIKKIVEAFGNAAQLAAMVGIDGIEIHGHEGYLIDQFMTTLWNKRTDEYGGELENRLRFPLEIIEKIRDTVGKNFPLIFRFGVKHFAKACSHFGNFPWDTALESEEFEEKGRDIPESIEIAKILEKAGVDALDLDVGCYEGWYWAHPPIYQPHGYAVDMISKVKKTVNIPVITAGRLDVPELAEKILSEGKADIISLGRALLADPYWPQKVKEGKVEEIRPCIGCHDGCVQRVLYRGRTLGCTVNPTCGREKVYPLSPAIKAKKVMIIGGGVAGMETARIAALRGHNVTIYEKSGKLGGHLIEASTPDFKSDIKRLLSWYITQINKLGVKVVLNMEVDADFVRKENPDVVIVATGSSPTVPEIKGLRENPIVASVIDILLGKKKAGEKIVILGGGLNGCETGLWLARQGKRVTIVEQLSQIMTDGVIINREMLFALLVKNNVQIITNATIEEVGKASVTIIDKEKRRTKIDCDTLILATGLKPNNDIYVSLIKQGILEVYRIGDCKEPRKIFDAIHEGFLLGIKI